MSGPYVFTPGPSHFSSGYINANYQTPQHSPFIPNTTLYPSSPYSNPTSAPGSPHIPALSLAPPPSPGGVVFPFDPSWDSSVVGGLSGYTRPRRLSYHGDLAPPTSPFFSDSYRLDDPYRERRRSFGGATYQPIGWGPAFTTPIAPPSSPSEFLLHPWLNADVWRGDFVMDLTLRDFRPLQVNSSGQARPCPVEYMSQPATHPPITRLRIVSELLPEWPVDISYSPQFVGGSPSSTIGWTPGFGIDTTGTQPPILFSDVVIAIHKSLHTRITYGDFNRLSLAQERAVTKAYLKRCRAAGSFEASERAQGVKRVDYLLDRKWFRGCVLDWDTGVFRLVVA